MNNYWTLPPSKQADLLKDLKEQALQEEADERHMLVYNGKLIKPEDYPCECELEEAQLCYEERKDEVGVNWTKKEIEDEYCWCPCHTWSEGIF